MANNDISCVASVNTSYESIKQLSERRIAKIRQQYDETIKENTYYREIKVYEIIIFLALAAAILYFVTFKREDLLFFVSYQFPTIDFKESMVEKILLYCGYIVAMWMLYKAIVLIYCMKLKGYSRRIDKIEKTISKRIDALNSSSIQNDMMKAITNNVEYDFPVKNDIGEMISSLNNDLAKTNKKAYNIRRVIRYAVTIVTFLLLYVFDFRFFMQNGSESVELAPFFLMLATAILVHLFEFNLGEYLGKLAKPAGILAAAVSCVFIMLGLKKLMPGDFLDFNIPVINKGYIIVPIIAFIGIVVSVWFSHYESERDKWQNGFEIPMDGGRAKPGDKKILLTRGGLSLLLAAVAMWLSTGIPNFVSAIFLGIVWYLAHPLMKLGLSYIFIFFGKGKCIGNEIIMLALCLFLEWNVVGCFDKEALIFVAIAVAARFAAVIAGGFVSVARE